MASHHGTGELALLPTDMEWREEIHFNDNHQAYLVNVAGQTRWVSAFLNHHLYKAGEKKLVCSWLPDRPEKLLVKEEINQANTTWLPHKRVLIDVANQRQRNLAVWPRMLPKEGMSCSIDLHSLHKDAGIQVALHMVERHLDLHHQIFAPGLRSSTLAPQDWHPNGRGRLWMSLFYSKFSRTPGIVV